MLNYLKSEVYQVLHRKAPYVFILVCSALLIAMNVVLHRIGANDPKFEYDTTAFSFSNIYSNMHYIMFLCLAVSSIIFGDEHQNHTFKNSISFGISRSTIFISKIIIQIVYSLIAFVIIIGCLVVSGSLLLENTNTDIMSHLIQSCMAGVPFFIFTLILYTTLYALLEKTGLSTGTACIILFVIPLILNEFANRYEIAKTIAEYLPLNMISACKNTENGFIAAWFSTEGMLKYYIVGLIYSVGTFVIGLLCFRKKEIK